MSLAIFPGDSAIDSQEWRTVARIQRFESQRYVGSRDTMVVYDTDDASQAEELSARVGADDFASEKVKIQFANLVHD